MEKGSRVKDIKEGQSAKGIFVASEIRKAQSRNGTPYWCLKLTDATGTIDAKIWSPLAEKIEPIDDGAFVSICGRGSVYRDSLQIVLDDLQELPDLVPVPLAEFMPSSPRDNQEMWLVLRQHCEKEFTYGPWKDFICSVLDDETLMVAFRLHPAAKSVHQAYAGGLLEHTLNVFELCQSICDRYRALDRQTLLAAALFHDIGKIRELKGGLNPDYTPSGHLLGHIFLGMELLAPYLGKSKLPPGLQEHLKHLILSHHGELAYGAVRVPQTAEAFVLHFIDNLDAKIAQCQQLLKDVPEENFSIRSPLLERKIYRPTLTPVAEDAIPERMEVGEPPIPGEDEIPAEEEDWQDWEAWDSLTEEADLPWLLRDTPEAVPSLMPKSDNCQPRPESKAIPKKQRRNSCKVEQCSLLLKA